MFKYLSLIFNLKTMIFTLNLDCLVIFLCECLVLVSIAASLKSSFSLAVRHELFLLSGFLLLLRMTLFVYIWGRVLFGADAKRWWLWLIECHHFTLIYYSLYTNVIVAYQASLRLIVSKWECGIRPVFSLHFSFHAVGAMFSLYFSFYSLGAMCSLHFSFHSFGVVFFIPVFFHSIFNLFDHPLVNFFSFTHLESILWWSNSFTVFRYG